MEITFSEAARQLGHKSRATLYRCRDDGRLDGYLAADGRIEMEPDGRRPLAEHLAGVIQQQRPKGSDRGQLEAELTSERTRRLRLENDVREGQLVEVAALEPALFRCFTEVRDALDRMPGQMASQAVALGLPAAAEFELRAKLEAVVDAACESIRALPVIAR